MSYIKKFASITEIFIISTIFMYLAGRTYTKYKVDDIKSNWVKHRENPLLIPVAGTFGKDPTKVFHGFVGQTIQRMFGNVKTFFNYIILFFHKIFRNFKGSLDKIRALTRPMRTFFRNAAEIFYKKLSNFMIAITYSLHKLRNSLRRSVSGFHMAFHTLNTLAFSLQSIIKSPIIRMVKKFTPPLDWISGAFNTLGLCFSGDTPIKTNRGKVPIKLIQPGDRLDDTTYVVATQKILNNTELYEYDGINVSGSHLVYEKGNWIRIKDSALSEKTSNKHEYIYCISTSNGTIHIKNHIFKDFNETTNQEINKIINRIILEKLNNTDSDLIIEDIAPKYLEHGLNGDTPIMINSTSCKKLKDLQIGDKILNGTVLGLIRVDQEFCTVYKYKNKFILSGNVKVFENDRWINVSKSLNSKKILGHLDNLYHVITSSGLINIDINTKITDYIEVHDSTTNNRIDNLIDKFNN